VEGLVLPQRTDENFKKFLQRRDSQIFSAKVVNRHLLDFLVLVDEGLLLGS